VRLGDDADLERICDAAATVGVHTVVQAVSPRELWESEDGVARVAERLNRAAERAAAAGLRTGYHNHHWELAALERFAGLLDPEVVLELDTYWAAVGGHDVPALLRRLGDRVRLLHLKDGPISRDNTEQLPLGRGAMPVEEIVAAAGAAELGVLEFDDYAGDVFEGLAEGFAYATGLGIR
jgi:sugar phosphate isomerase/epimerase